MLRDPHHWINTTSFGHGKVLPYQQRAPPMVTTYFKAVLLQYSKCIS